MTKYILDTNICVFGLRGQFEIKKRIQEIGLENICISEITVLELLYGAYKSRYSEKQMLATRNFLAGPEIISISKYREEYASERAYLESIGKPLHDDFDLLIGVTAVSEKFILVTDNIKHFQNIRNLKTENWIER